MNLDPAMTTGYVVVAVGGFGLGALAGRWMMAEMRSAFSAVQLRLSALEQKVTGYSAAPAAAAVTANGNSAAPTVPIAHPAAVAPQPAPAPAAPTAVTAAAAQAAALEHHASAVEKLAAAIDKHAQAVDDHGAATVAAAVEMDRIRRRRPYRVRPCFRGPRRRSRRRRMRRAWRWAQAWRRWRRPPWRPRPRAEPARVARIYGDAPDDGDAAMATGGARAAGRRGAGLPGAAGASARRGARRVGASERVVGRRRGEQHGAPKRSCDPELRGGATARRARRGPGGGRGARTRGGRRRQAAMRSAANGAAALKGARIEAGCAAAIRWGNAQAAELGRW